ARRPRPPAGPPSARPAPPAAAGRGSGRAAPRARGPARSSAGDQDVAEGLGLREADLAPARELERRDEQEALLEAVPPGRHLVEADAPRAGEGLAQPDDQLRQRDPA